MSKRRKPAGGSLHKRRARDVAQLVSRAIAPFLPRSLQAALAAVDKTLDIRPATILDERLRELIEGWRAEIRRPLEERYHPQHLDAQSFTQLILLAAEAAVRERLAGKRRMYARILARADTPEWAGKVDRVEEVLLTLVGVTEADLRVLNAIMDRFKRVDRTAPPALPEAEHRKAYKVTISELSGELGDLSPAGVKTYVNRLERLGLLLNSPTVGDDVDTGDYIPTHILQELMLLVAEG